MKSKGNKHFSCEITHALASWVIEIGNFVALKNVLCCQLLGRPTLPFSELFHTPHLLWCFFPLSCQYCYKANLLFFIMKAEILGTLGESIMSLFWPPKSSLYGTRIIQKHNKQCGLGQTHCHSTKVIQKCNVQSCSKNIYSWWSNTGFTVLAMVNIIQ